MSKYKYRAILYLSILLICIFTQVNAASSKVDEQIKAVIETARTYYRQGAQLQYDSYRKNLYATPEDATSKHTVYTVCSGLTFQSYYQALGIEIPDTTEGLINYARDNKSSSQNVLMYFGNKKEVYSSKCFGTNSSPKYAEFTRKIVSIAQPGDIFVVTRTCYVD